MAVSSSKIFLRMASATCLAGFALLGAGCDELMGGGKGEAQFLTRRVEQLEAKVKTLEEEIARMRALGAARPAPAISQPPVSPVTPGAGGIGTGVAPAPAGAPGATPGTVASSLMSDQDRANVLLLKAKQLQVASRAELPGLIRQLGVSAPEVDQLQQQIQGLEVQRATISDPTGVDAARAKALDEEIDKLKFRLELAAEGVRRRVIEEGRQASARLQEAPPEEAGSSTGANPGQ